MSTRRESMPMTTESAEALLRDIWREVTRERDIPTRTVLLMVLAIARGESGYGMGWQNDDLIGNWASAQCPNKGSDCSQEAQKGNYCALASDTHDGTEKTRYAQCFKTYLTHRDGAIDFLKELIVRRKAVRETLNTSDALLVAHVMRRLSYFDKDLPERHYATMIYLNAQAITKRLRWQEAVSLRPCKDCGVGNGETCKSGCPGTYYEGPPNTSGAVVPWVDPGEGRAPSRRRVTPSPPLIPAPASFDGGGGALIVGLAVAALVGVGW